MHVWPLPHPLLSSLITNSRSILFSLSPSTVRRKCKANKCKDGNPPTKVSEEGFRIGECTVLGPGRALLVLPRRGHSASMQWSHSLRCVLSAKSYVAPSSPTPGGVGVVDSVLGGTSVLVVPYPFPSPAMFVMAGSRL